MITIRRAQLSVTVPEDLVEFMDREVDRKIYSSRSHAISRALQELKDRTEKKNK